MIKVACLHECLGVAANSSCLLIQRVKSTKPGSIASKQIYVPTELNELPLK